VPDPRFRDNRIDREPNPECRAEKVVRRKARELAGGKEYPHDRSHCRDSERDRRGANHPLAMRCLVAMPDAPEPSQQSKQKECTERNNGHYFAHPADGVLKDHQHANNCGDDTVCNENPPDPAVDHGTSYPNFRHELKRDKDDEQQPTRDMDPRQCGFALKSCVQVMELGKI
jgi:hypothetical protein